MSEYTDGAVDARLRREALFLIASRLKTSIINKGLLLSLALVVVSTLLMARYQGSTALAILRYTPPVALFTGALANLLPLVLPLIYLAYLAASANAWSSGRFGTGISTAAAASACWVAMQLFVDRSVRTPTWVIILLVAIAVGAGVVTYRWPKRFISENGSAMLEPLVIILMVALVFSQAIGNQELKQAISTPFLPAESVTIPGTTPKTAYVLDSSPQWTTLLINSTRKIEIVRTADITKREVCSVLGTGVVKPSWALSPPSEPVISCRK